VGKLNIIIKIIGILILITLLVLFIFGLQKFYYAIPKAEINTNDIAIFKIRVSYVAVAVLVLVFSIAGLTWISALVTKKVLNTDYKQKLEIYAEHYSNGQLSKSRSEAEYYKKLYEASESNRKKEKDSYRDRYQLLISAMNINLMQDGE
jgi:hypothetical protein